MEVVKVAQLRQMLENYKDRVETLDFDQTAEIRASLNNFGVALVRSPADFHQRVVQDTGRNMADTFSLIPDDVKAELRTGVFTQFNELLKKSGASTRYKIAGIGSGMINRYSILKTHRASYTHPITGTVHIPNAVNAKNNIMLWEKIARQVPGYKEWFGDVPVDFVVPEDGVKIMLNKSYNPTGLHYDGQMAGQRIQIVYCNDTGPTHLQVCPGSNSVEVQTVLNNLLGIRLGANFETHQQTFAANPEVRQAFMDNGVHLDGPGFLLFKAQV